MADCVFCDKIAAGDFDDEENGIVWFEPLNPVAPGHTLFVPREHVIDAKASPELTGRTMAVAADLARVYRSSNLITSIGANATQTVFHLHVHLVPRRLNDDLHLPWTGQQREVPGE